ncbi:hypothetical protein [Methylocapsa palsarum]|nr:hypothetical protein [Methylocapsa palsarum]
MRERHRRSSDSEAAPNASDDLPTRDSIYVFHVSFLLSRANL